MVGTEPLFGEVDYFDRARDLVQLCIAAVSSGQEPPSELRRDVFARFGVFGRTLGDEDAIVVAPPGRRDGARYDKQLRRKLVLLADRAFEDNVSLIGEVRAANKDVEEFTLRTPDGRKIDVRTPSSSFRLALQSFNESALVRLRGTGLFDREGTLQKITRVSDLSLAEEDDESTQRPGCPTKIETQIESLLAVLRRAGSDEDSPAFDRDALSWLTKLVSGIVDVSDYRRRTCIRRRKAQRGLSGRPSTGKWLQPST